MSRNLLNIELYSLKRLNYTWHLLSGRYRISVIIKLEFSFLPYPSRTGQTNRNLNFSYSLCVSGLQEYKRRHAPSQERNIINKRKLWHLNNNINFIHCRLIPNQTEPKICYISKYKYILDTLHLDTEQATH